MKNVTITFSLLVLICVFMIVEIVAKPVDVILEPAGLGKPSRVISVLNDDARLTENLRPPNEDKVFFNIGDKKNRSFDYVIAYDYGNFASSLGGLQQGYHLGVWFEPPAACTLLAIFYYFYISGDVTYYVADPSDSIDFLNDYEEYHGGQNPGPDPRETYLHPEEPRTPPVMGWDTLFVTELPDVGENVFFAAYIMDDGVSSPIIDASISPPYHTLMQRPGGGGGPFGWYSSWHHVYIRALVRIYEAVSPIIENITQYATTITTGPYPVDATVVCFVDSLLYVNLLVTANGIEDTIAMIPSKSDTLVYSASIPAYSQQTEIMYHIEAMDSDSFFSTSDTSGFWFLVPEGAIIYVDESLDPQIDYGDIFDSLGITGGYDIYDKYIQGIPDTTFLDYLLYYAAVIWNGDYGYSTILTKESVTNVLYQYMLFGGSIFFGSDEILGVWDGWTDIDYYPGEFPYDVLGVTHVYNDISYDSIYGVVGDTISDGIISNRDNPFTNWNDEVDILPSAIDVFMDAAGNNVRGARRDDGYNKVVFLPFMYVSMPKSLQVEIMRRILEWFGVSMNVSETKTPGVFPYEIKLAKGMPNPFNKCTRIQYHIPASMHINLSIYNCAGQLVKTLVNGIESSGSRSIIWHGENNTGSEVSQGIYYCRLKAGTYHLTEKLLLIE
jgi:hypothetical protein